MKAIVYTKYGPPNVLQLEAADFDWIDDSDASLNSRAHFQRYSHDKWRRTKNGAMYYRRDGALPPPAAPSGFRSP